MDRKENLPDKVPATEPAQLGMFAGTWQLEGMNFPAGPNGGGAAIGGEEVYEWLKGNFYLVGRWRHSFGNGSHEGISILGFDEAGDGLLATMFVSLGYKKTYVLKREDNTWKYTGETERATRSFSDDGNHFTENWQMKNAEGDWIPACILNGTKVK